MNQELKTQLTKFAESDLRLARKQGDTAVTGTKQGVIWVSYHEKEKAYTLLANRVKLASKVKKAKAVEILVNNYNVTYE